MTVFTALGAIDNSVVNRAEVQGASDWYGNDLAGGADDVPITIVEGPTATPGPTDTSQPRPTLTPTPVPTSTTALAPSVTPHPTTPHPTTPSTPILPTITPVTPPTPPFLPESGRARGTWREGFLLIVILAVGWGGIVLVRRKKIA